MDSRKSLAALAQLGFKISGESGPLGFEIGRISRTTSKLPTRLDEKFQSLLSDDWPSDFYLGRVEFFGPDRINFEHNELYPGLAVIPHGFFCFGSGGDGDTFAYCVHDKCVYLLPCEHFGDAGLRSTAWAPIEMNPANIKGVALRSWGSLDAFFDWALIELRKIQRERDEESG